MLIPAGASDFCEHPSVLCIEQAAARDPQPEWLQALAVARLADASEHRAMSILQWRHDWLTRMSHSAFSHLATAGRSARAASASARLAW